jgi:hypothetical protein
VAGERNLTTRDELLRGGYTMIPWTIMERPDLSGSTKLFYGVLLYYLWRGEDYPGHEATAERVGISRKTCSRAVAELEKAMLIRANVERYGMPLQIEMLPIGDSACPSRDILSLRRDNLSHAEGQFVPPLYGESRIDRFVGPRDMLASIAAEFAPNEPTTAVVHQLREYSPATVQVAAEHTRAASGVDKPIAYLLAECRRIADESGEMRARERRDAEAALEQVRAQAALLRGMRGGAEAAGNA